MENMEGQNPPDYSVQAQQTGQSPQGPPQPMPGPQPYQQPPQQPIPPPSKKPMWPIAVAAIVVAVVVIVVLILYLPILSPFGEKDSDGDGVPDNEDFWDSGNGGVRISITHFSGDCDNWFGSCEPEFTIKVDVDNDGVYEQSKTRTFGDYDEMYDVMEFDVDIEDDQSAIAFTIEVWDDDGNDKIDYNPTTGVAWMEHTVNFPYSHDDWSSSGLGSTRCLLEYEIRAIGM